MNLWEPLQRIWSKICRACLLSLIQEGNVLTKGSMTLSRKVDMSSVGQLQAETIGLPELSGL